MNKTEHKKLSQLISNAIEDAFTGGDPERIISEAQSALDSMVQTRARKPKIDPHLTAMEMYRDGIVPPKPKRAKKGAVAAHWCVSFADGDEITTTTFGETDAERDHAIAYARTVKMNRERGPAHWVKLQDGTSRLTSWCEIAAVSDCFRLDLSEAEAA